ncbi:hypothetical protein ACL02T_15735 [Pseudonocardia sp. RS010]|uniref:hypothetical protein n=1 Tax=Pseudonocardia sp. RS010 TaxID=3385979 RepID=UPI0039A0E38C
MTASAEHPNAALLRRAYQDYDFMLEQCADDIVVHPQGTTGMGKGDCVGKVNFTKRVEDMKRLSGNSLSEPVEIVIANDHFGASFARFQVQRGDDELDVPICGVWRFGPGPGVLVEHWELCADWPAVERFFGLAQAELGT